MKAIFIDIDNTLLDFDAYVRTTMEQGFAHFGLPAYHPEMYHTFTAENNKLWRQIEEGTLTFAELQKIRWNNVFAALGIHFDGPAFEHYFRAALHESAIPVPGAMELLQSLSGRALPSLLRLRLPRAERKSLRPHPPAGNPHHRGLSFVRYCRWPAIRHENLLLPPPRGPRRSHRGR